MLIRTYDELQLGPPFLFPEKDSWYCTMTRSAPVVRTRLQRNGQWAWPALPVAYRHFTGEDIIQTDDPVANGLAVVRAVRAVYQGMTS